MRNRKSTARQLDSEAARRLAKKGAEKGGAARALALRSTKRSAIAAAGAAARWKRPPRIRITFVDHRTPDWRLENGLRPLLLGTDVIDPMHGEWQGEALIGLEAAYSAEVKLLDLLPEAPEWIDRDAMRLLVQQQLRNWHSGAWGAATYLVRERDGEWYQESGDAGAGARGEEA